MYNRILIALILLLNLSQLNAQDTNIFLFENEKGFSYMDASGKPVMTKYFLYAGRFFEEMAVASDKGYVGYINKIGEFIIPPIYEYALPFNGGIAKVWLDGKQYLIDKKGQILFDHNYRYIDYAIYNSKEPIFRVTTGTGKKGIVDKQGNLLVDTIFSNIYDFNHGFATVQNLVDEKYQVSVIDLRGKQILPYGEYNEIGLFSDGRAFVKSNKWPEDSFGFIDTAGNLVYKKDDCLSHENLFPNHYRNERYVAKVVKSYSIYQNGICGNYLPDEVLIAAIENKYYRINWLGDTTQDLATPEYTPAVLDLYGNIIFRDDNAGFIYPYQNGFASVKSDSGDYLIDKSGKKYGQTTHPIAAFIKNDNTYLVYKNGVVKNDQGITTSVKNLFVNYMSFEENIDEFIHKEMLFINEGVVFHSKTTCDSIIWELYNNRKIRFASIDYKGGFKNGLLQVVLSGVKPRWGYINKHKELVYLSPGLKSNSVTSKININYGLSNCSRTGCVNDSTSFNRYQAREIPDEFYHIKVPAAILDTVLHVKKGRNNISGKIYVHKLSVLNPSDKTLVADLKDRKIWVQAKDRNGNWRDIEFYIPTAITEDDYPNIYLKPNKYWTKDIMAYDGGFRTKMRVIVHFPYIRDQKSGVITSKPLEIISNEIDCSINASQFIRQEYYKSEFENIPFEDYQFDGDIH